MNGILGLVIVMAVAGLAAQSQNRPEPLNFADCLIAQDKAWFLRPAVMVGRDEGEAEWSPTGGHIAFSRPDGSMKIYTLSTGRSWTPQFSKALMTRLDWTDDGKHILRKSYLSQVPGQPAAALLHCLTLSTGTVRLLDRVEADTYENLDYSWSIQRKIGAVTTRRGGRYGLIDLATGAFSTPPLMEAIDKEGFYIDDIDKAGGALLKQIGDVERHYVGRLSSRDLREVSEAEYYKLIGIAYSEGETKLPFEVAQRPLEDFVPDIAGDDRNLISLIGVKEVDASGQVVPRRRTDKTVLVSGDGSNPKLSPTGSGILFDSLDCTWIRRIEPIDVRQAHLARVEHVKSEAIYHAKQVATAALQYSDDNNDLLPPAKDFAEKVKPYLRNSESLKNFTYLLNGESFLSFDDLHTTELGMIQTEFGTVVVRVDTSAIWKPNGKTPNNSLTHPMTGSAAASHG